MKSTVSAARGITCRLLLTALLAVLALTCSACSVRPPDSMAPSPAQTPAPAEATQTPEASIEALVTPEPAQATPQPTRAPESAVYTDITQVDIFLDATLSMLGYVDTPSVSLYARAADALNTSIAQCFPDAGRSFYRADIDWESTESAAVSSATVVQEAREPWFYLVHDLTHLPDRIWLDGETSWSAGQRMNEFTTSYYAHTARSEPLGSETQTPVTWAVRQGRAAPGRVTLIVTDLEELQSYAGELIQALRTYAFEQDQTLGILAADSAFSGLIPLHSAGGTTWHEWGALPSGAAGKVLDYGPYTLGVTQEAGDRGSKARPFYVLCIGESDVLNSFLPVLREQLQGMSGTADAAVSYWVFDTAFVPEGTDIALTTRLSGSSSGGVNISQSEVQRTGNSYVQLQRAEATTERFVTFETEYTPRSSDPRTGAFQASDFLAEAALYHMDEQQDRGERAEVSAAALSVALAIGENTEQRVLITAKQTYGYGLIPKGDYVMEITLYLQPPQAGGIPAWAQALDTDLARQTAGFDGTKTAGLASLMQSVSSMRQSILQPVALGSFSYPLYVVVDE